MTTTKPAGSHSPMPRGERAYWTHRRDDLNKGDLLYATSGSAARKFFAKRHELLYADCCAKRNGWPNKARHLCAISVGASK